MTRTRTVLVTGATGRVGRLVVDELLRADVAVRALTRRPEAAALPGGAEVVPGDLTVPASLDAALERVTAVFLVWTAPLASAAAVISRLAVQQSGELRRLVYLSSPHQTPHPFFQQPNSLRGLHAELERLLDEDGFVQALHAAPLMKLLLRRKRAGEPPAGEPVGEPVRK